MLHELPNNLRLGGAYVPTQEKRLRKDQNNLKTSWSYNLVPSLPLKKKILSILAKDHFKIEIELFPWCFFEFAKSRGLRRCVVCVGAWLHGSIYDAGCVGCVGQNIFYVGQHFMWVIIFTWVAWVKSIFAWVKSF